MNDYRYFAGARRRTAAVTIRAIARAAAWSFMLTFVVYLVAAFSGRDYVEQIEWLLIALAAVAFTGGVVADALTRETEPERSAPTTAAEQETLPRTGVTFEDLQYAADIRATVGFNGPAQYRAVRAHRCDRGDACPLGDEPCAGALIVTPFAGGDVEEKHISVNGRRRDVA